MKKLDPVKKFDLSPRTRIDCDIGLFPNHYFYDQLNAHLKLHKKEFRVL